MKAKQTIFPVVLLGFVLSLFFAPGFAEPQKQKDKKAAPPAEEKIFIPKEVKTVLQEGIELREGRQDIPFDIFKHLYLPARDSIHNIFMFKVKNSDLGFVPVALPPQKEEKKEEEQAAEEEEIAKYRAGFNVFLEFLSLKNGKPVQVAREVYIPAGFEIDASDYDPEKEEIYTLGYPLLPGDYLMAMAVTSMDLQRIGTFYLEFSNPDIRSFTDTLDTTPIFFVKEMKQMEAPEMRAEIHKGYFTYSILQVVPNFDYVFAPGENLDIFFFIFGAMPDNQQKFQIETHYEVKKDDELAIRYEPTNYDSPLISQPLPMKQTVIIKTQEEEKKEVRDLPPDHYTLNIKITDKISGHSTTKSVNFEVR